MIKYIVIFYLRQNMALSERAQTIPLGDILRQVETADNVPFTAVLGTTVSDGSSLFCPINRSLSDNFSTGGRKLAC